MATDLTVTNSACSGWTVRFLDQKEWNSFKREEKFGAKALRATKLKKSWPASAVFQGALAYHEGKVVHLTPTNRAKWLADRNLMEARL